jgi:hypothetical protein
MVESAMLNVQLRLRLASRHALGSYVYDTALAEML